MKTPNKELVDKAYERGIQQHLKRIAESGSDLHENYTPAEICDMMLDKVDLKKAESILVLYNIELLFALKKRRFSGRVTFFTQSQEKVQIASKILPNVEVEYIDKEENPIYHMENKWPEKFDIVIANPPYSKKLDLKFLDKAFDVAKEEVVFIHPATPFIERKGVTNIYKNVINKIKENIKSITLFNGNGPFKIALYVPITITHITKSEFQKYILVENLVTKKTKKLKASNLEDVCYFGYDENFVSLDKKINPEKNLSTENGNNPELKYIVQISNRMGHTWSGDRTKLEIDSQIMQPNFFCIVRKATKVDEEKNINYNIRWYFKTSQEANNFISYCKTYFSRMCIALTKINHNLGSYELSRVPWLDFTQEWTDEKLYAHFNITEEEQAFIKEVIPPYYD